MGTRSYIGNSKNSRKCISIGVFIDILCMWSKPGTTNLKIHEKYIPICSFGYNSITINLFF